MRVYKFRKYEKIYPILYLLEEKRIKKYLTKKHLIAHIGSSAVIGLAGKGIIDIMISCSRKDIPAVKKSILKVGYEQGSSSDKDRLFFKMEKRIKNKERRFHLHITPLNHLLWKKANAFRDYLQANKIIAKKYEILKKKAIKECNNEGKRYRELKNEFIAKHTAKALKSKN